MVFTDDEVAALNEYQHSGLMHPFTCGNRKNIQETHADGEGILVATNEGWICPFCNYKQYWAHPFMMNPNTIKELSKAMAASSNLIDWSKTHDREL
jgi:hypothetical protein